jgi:hypothetical protein
LWVSTPRVIAVASIGMHRDTFSPPAQLVSIALHICTIFTRAEARRTHLRWAFTAGKHKLLSSHAQPGPVVARAPTRSTNQAQGTFSACVNLGQTDRGSPLPEYSQV